MGELVAESKRVLDLAIRSELALQRSAHTKRFVPTGVTDLHGGTRVVDDLVHAKLGWQPTTTLEELVAEMVATDREEARKEAILRLKGFNVVGSMENPPTNPAAVAQAQGTQGS